MNWIDDELDKLKFIQASYVFYIISITRISHKTFPNKYYIHDHVTYMSCYNKWFDHRVKKEFDGSCHLCSMLTFRLAYFFKAIAL